MDKSQIQKFFMDTVNSNPDMSPAIAAIQTLIEFLAHSEAETMAELRATLNVAIDHLCKTESYFTTTSINSGCDLFIRFITLARIDHSDFDECKSLLIERGQQYLEKAGSSREKIARRFHPFIKDGANILVHSKSRVVLQALKEAAKYGRRFHVYVTEAGPDKSGVEMSKNLNDAGIRSTVILDGAVGYIMEKIDLVVMGAEGVVESGGIINKIGSFTTSIVAKEHNKPVFVLAESFKFVRFFPLNQRDVRDDYKYSQATILRHADLSKEHPQSDYTPPMYITLLFTDLGVLTPSAVSDELIGLYM